MRRTGGCLALLSALGAFAQVPFMVDTIRAVQPWAPNETYTFPRLVMPERPAIAARINKHLCTVFLEVDPDTANGHYFDRVWGDNVGWTTPRLSYLEWNVSRPLPNVLEVELSGEGCGAYCEGFVTHYHYDLRDGGYIGLDSLITPEGRSAFTTTIHTRWEDTITTCIAIMLDSAALPSLDTEILEHLQATMEMYQQCLDDRSDGDAYVSDFTAEIDGIRFFTSRCAPHVVQELDVLDPVSFVLPYSTCTPWMRVEVRSLFP